MMRSMEYTVRNVARDLVTDILESFGTVGTRVRQRRSYTP